MTALDTFKQVQVLLGLTGPDVDGLNGSRTRNAFEALGAAALAQHHREAAATTGYVDGIIDLYHGEDIDFEQAQAGGLLALIHKATQGASYRDVKYSARRAEAHTRSILFGSYHFGTGEAVIDQVKNYLTTAQPASGELVALDYEPNTSGLTMKIDQAREFAQRVFDAIGRWPVLYSGNLIRETWSHIDNDPLANCRLWYARYSMTPAAFDGPWAFPPFLWQYTDGDAGIEPHTFPGIGPCDRNRFYGTLDELRAQWAV